jgi:hypothetical protein
MWRSRWMKNKYGAKSTIYNGIQYHSKMESKQAADLDLLKRAGEIKEWDRQIPIELDVNGRHICKYYVDFRVFHNDDSVELIEVKGFETEVFRLKRKLLEATYLKENPNVRYTVVK